MNFIGLAIGLNQEITLLKELLLIATGTFSVIWLEGHMPLQKFLDFTTCTTENATSLKFQNFPFWHYYSNMQLAILCSYERIIMCLVLWTCCRAVPILGQYKYLQTEYLFVLYVEMCSILESIFLGTEESPQLRSSIIPLLVEYTA